MNDSSLDAARWLPATVACSPLAPYRAIEVAGPDAAGFLQGQLSSNIAALANNPGQFSSYNSPKGRVLAFLRVVKHDARYWLFVDEDIADTFTQRLRMFVLRSKVTIETAPHASGLVVAGRETEAALTANGLPFPAPGVSIEHESRIYFRVPGPVSRVDIFGAPGTLPGLDIAQATENDLERWDVLFHLPRILPRTQDAHVAQHLNLDELGAISFRKGCYTGQEIIARMKYLGKVKKRAAAFFGRDAKPGDPVRTEDNRAAGEIVNVAPVGDGQLILAVVNLDDQDQPLRVNGSSLARIKSNGQD